jgi:hypothetical protein
MKYVVAWEKIHHDFVPSQDNVKVNCGVPSHLTSKSCLILASSHVCTDDNRSCLLLLMEGGAIVAAGVAVWDIIDFQFLLWRYQELARSREPDK